MKTASPLQRYGIALFSCAIALGLSFPSHAPESCFFVAVIVTNLWGGRGPGFVSVVLTAVSLDYFFLAPEYHLSLDLSSVAGILVFLGATVVVTLLIDAKRRVEASHREISSQYQTVAETAPDAILSIDDDRKVTLANPAAARIFGWPSAELLGQRVDALMPGVELRKGVTAAELTGVRKDGTHFSAEVSLGEIPGDDRTSFTGFVRDVTERKRAEAALQKSEASLAQAQKFAAAGEMAASIAHEVNQPLSAIVANGYACIRWLSADPPSIPKAAEAAERVVRDGKDAGDIIRHVRSLFKRGATEKVALDLNEIVRESLRLLRGEVARRRAMLTVDLAQNLPLVMGDRIQLQQLVLNLLINALEAMDSVTDRTREIVVRSSVAEQGVLVEVHDTGVGIENPEKIFDAFFTTKENGLGMGLAISRSIVEAHNGRLWASSQQHQGTTFSFTIPGAASAAA